MFAYNYTYTINETYTLSLSHKTYIDTDTHAQGYITHENFMLTWADTSVFLS